VTGQHDLSGGVSLLHGEGKYSRPDQPDDPSPGDTLQSTPPTVAAGAMATLRMR
jgi:hypothetical protein